MVPAQVLLIDTSGIIVREVLHRSSAALDKLENNSLSYLKKGQERACVHTQFEYCAQAAPMQTLYRKQLWNYVPWIEERAKDEIQKCNDYLHQDEKTKESKSGLPIHCLKASDTYDGIDICASLIRECARQMTPAPNVYFFKKTRQNSVFSKIQRIYVLSFSERFEQLLAIPSPPNIVLIRRNPFTCSAEERWCFANNESLLHTFVGDERQNNAKNDSQNKQAGFTHDKKQSQEYKSATAVSSMSVENVNYIRDYLVITRGVSGLGEKKAALLVNHPLWPGFQEFIPPNGPCTLEEATTKPQWAQLYSQKKISSIS
ncbi:hypothetical protein RFI_36153 [Reticulomyxa filosa]|uniref:Uncharacterized protein n=1 Tax=Reticulomyxa filosa TaxID=46433 RepID=X6LJH0_RETFI|nr:hypothetical protein RFI_36153 [Reticulomyxa filosa]|eukprot:ETO01287.1 hypothetical protein RFI_36153 [Reticulomyxa filosa]